MILHFLFTLDSSKAYAVNLHTALGISKSSVSSTLKSLKRKGYLEIISDASDDRKKKLILTDKANRMRESIDHKLQMQQEQISREIPSEHLLWIEKDLNTMINNLKKQEQEGQSYAQNASGSGEAI